MEDTYLLRLSRRCYYVCLAICAVGLIIYLVLHKLDISITQLNPSPCVLYTFFGIYCPGCGGTRAIEYLLQGDFLSSFIYHPVVPYTAVLMGCYLVSHTLSIMTKGKIKAMLFRPIYLYIMLAVIVLQWIVKNALIFTSGLYLIG